MARIRRATQGPGSRQLAHGFYPRKAHNEAPEKRSIRRGRRERASDPRSVVEAPPLSSPCPDLAFQFLDRPSSFGVCEITNSTVKPKQLRERGGKEEEEEEEKDEALIFFQFSIYSIALSLVETELSFPDDRPNDAEGGRDLIGGKEGGQRSMRGQRKVSKCTLRVVPMQLCPLVMAPSRVRCSFNNYITPLSQGIKD